MIAGEKLVHNCISWDTRREALSTVWRDSAAINHASIGARQLLTGHAFLHAYNREDIAIPQWNFQIL